MPFPLITSQHLIERIGPIRHRRVFDDQEIGMADSNAELQLRKDASSKVLGRVGRIYDVDVIRDMAQEALPEELVRLTLDVAHAMMAIRCPHAIEVDGHRMMRRADEDLDDLRKTKNSLGVNGAPEPAANQGAEVFGINPDTDFEPDLHTFVHNDFGEWG